ncbi:MAG: hypothetical protein ACTXOO_00510 [Sodalis sp. (in: enterobacteria)]
MKTVRARKYPQTIPEISYIVIDIETAADDTALQLMKAISNTIRAR